MPRSKLMMRVRAALAHGVDGRRAPREVPLDALPMSRRRFIEGSLATLSTLAVGPTLAGCSGRSTLPRGGTPRVVVVGAGMAGLHCALQLEALGLSPQVFEASRRVGGRMHSLRGHFANGQVCELGGELIDTGDRVMHALAAEFDIALDDRTEAARGLREAETWYFEGRHVPSEEVFERFRPTAQKLATEMEGIEEEENAERFARLNNMPLSEWLAANVEDTLVRALLDAAYEAEYGLECSNQSALNLHYLIDYEDTEEFHIFGESDERFHTHAGNDTFIQAIHSRLSGTVALGHVLTAVEEHADGTFTAHFDQGGTPVSATCDHLVLAIPLTTARNVDFQLEMPEWKARLIREIGYGTCSKIMLGYDQRVWRTQHSAMGSSTSELQFGQTWETSVGQAGDNGILTVYAGGAPGLRNIEGETHERARAIVQQIDTIYPGTAAVYTADSAVRMAWPTMPYALGAFVCYQPGQYDFYGLEGKRVRNMHFAGEHASTEKQGFMEGAAESGALVACEIARDLGLALTPLAERILGERLTIPQPAYFAESMVGLRKHDVRRVARAVRAQRSLRFAG
ncbi:MAG: NAD(P)/FAD-dependent oxidoreductase [Polyangiales bacterium]